MHLTPHQESTMRKSRRGFTLVELLVVMAIIGILVAVVSPLIPSLLRANQLDSNVNTLSGIMEQAREAAIAGNTYVWVAFTDPPAASPISGTWVATIQSKDGTESPINTTVTPSWLTTLTVPNASFANLQLLNKIQNLPGVKIVDAATANLSSTLIAKAPTASTGTLFETSLQWTVTPLQYTSAAGNKFTHAMEFTPDGEAHVPSWISNIQFGLVPSNGSTKDAALFNITRLTGKTTAYRP